MSSQEPSPSLPPPPSDPAPSDPPPPASSDPPPPEPSNPQPSDNPNPDPSGNPNPNPSPNPEPSNPNNPNPSQPQPSNPQPSVTPPPGGNNNPPPSQGSQVLTAPSSVVQDSTAVYTSNGSTYTTVTKVSTVLQPGATVPSLPNTTTGGGKSNTGAIVGGVVGGIVGIAGLILAFWFLTRRARQKRLEKEFDGDFNPDRIVRNSHTLPPGGGGTLPELGLDEEESRVTPFPAPSMSQHRPTPSTTTSFSTGNMYSVNPQQHVNDPHPYQAGYPMPLAVNRPPSSVGEHSQSIYSQSTGTAFTHPSMYQPQQQHAPYPVAGVSAYPQSNTSSSLSGGGAIPTRKAQEAGLGRMTVTNPNDVVVHQDGGRVPAPPSAPSTQQEELPPTYDSIPQDQAGSSNRT